jgi:hypothetical protein
MLKEYFLDKIKLKHPDNFNKYDYSLVPNEFKSKDKINIICVKHGMFQQIAKNHLTGKKCLKCKNFKHFMSHDNFIRKANLVFNYKYDYTNTKYTHSEGYITIECPIHGNYIQKARYHLKGIHCPACINVKLINTIKNSTYTKEEFIFKANLKHKTFYNYDKVIYKNINTKVIITCPKHGDFLQRPRDHLQGKGCPKCNDSFGEKYISQVLDKLNIQYLREYKISEYNYKYDFYLPKYNIYIEYHGIQHYEISNYFGGKKAFNKQQNRDKVKIELIKRSTGLLIVIKYTFRSLEQIEDELIRLFTYIHPQFFINVKVTKQAIVDSNIYLIDDGISYKRK